MTDVYKYSRYENGNLVEQIERPFTAKEKLDRWLVEISLTDRKLSRSVEDIIDALPDDVRSKIAQETLQAYQEKKLIRARKP